MNRHDVVLALLAVYLGAAFGLRSYLQLRRTGSTGFKGISGKPLSAAWLGGVLFVVALAGCVAAPLLARYGIDRVMFDPPVALDVIGGATFAAGTLFLLWSQGAMGRSWRIGVDHEEVTGLVTSGPFAHVRNPIFSAMLVSGVGFVLLLPNATAVASYALLFFAVELQVRYVEEPYLLRTHGGSYRAYAARVGRFVPKLGRL